MLAAIYCTCCVSQKPSRQSNVRPAPVAPLAHSLVMLAASYPGVLLLPQVYLAVLAMLWHPGKQGMELVQEGCRPGGYMVSVMSVSSNPLSTFVDK